MKKHLGIVKLNLRLFDGEEGAPVAPAAAPTQTAQATTQAATESAKAPIIHPRRQAMMNQVKTQSAPAAEKTIPTPSAQPNPQPEPVADVAMDRKAKFEELIGGEYKDLFSERTQKIINSRFKETKTLEAEAQKYKAIAERVASKYGADVNDPDGVLKSLDDDDSYYEEEAMNRGMTVAQLKEVKGLERELAQEKALKAEAAQKQQIEQRNARWYQESEELKKSFPNFDFMAEVQHPETGKQFAMLLSTPGISVSAAYKAIHSDDIIGGAMAHTAQQIQQKTVNDIRARGLRPVENGVSGHAPAQMIPQSAKNMTREDHKIFNKRAARGEEVRFGR